MRKLTARFLFALLLLVPAHARAQSNETPPPMSLDQQERFESASKANEVLNAFDAKAHAASVLKKNQCMKAFGNTEFCECIGEKSPVGVTFIGYVAIVAGTKDDFHYDQLSPENKELFDKTRAARDACVNWEGKSDKLKPATN